MKRASAGFSLLEVLVAFVILALTLSIMMQIFSGGLRNITHADDYGRAILLAESRLAELGVQPVEGESQGEFEGKYRWRGTVRPWSGAPDDTGVERQPLPVRLMEIEVRVVWGGAGESLREVVLNTFKLASVPGP